MFICQSCAQEKLTNPVLPFLLHLSRGPCEFCKRVANCADVPSSAQHWWRETAA